MIFDLFLSPPTGRRASQIANFVAKSLLFGYNGGFDPPLAVFVSLNCRHYSLKELHENI